MSSENTKLTKTVGMILLALGLAIYLISVYAFVPSESEIEELMLEPLLVWTPEVVIIKEAQTAEFEATGYAIGPPYSSITKNGSSVFNKGSIRIGNVDFFTIAVDPRVIPLGSLVYIDSLGIGMATDTGRKIKGMIIDICFSNMGEAMKWGRRKVIITVLRRGDNG